MPMPKATVATTTSTSSFRKAMCTPFRVACGRPAWYAAADSPSLVPTSAATSSASRFVSTYTMLGPTELLLLLLEDEDAEEDDEDEEDASSFRCQGSPPSLPRLRDLDEDEDEDEGLRRSTERRSFRTLPLFISTAYDRFGRLKLVFATNSDELEEEEEEEDEKDVEEEAISPPPRRPRLRQMSPWTWAVAVAVRAMMGTSGKASRSMCLSMRYSGRKSWPHSLTQ